MLNTLLTRWGHIVSPGAVWRNYSACVGEHHFPIDMCRVDLKQACIEAENKIVKVERLALDLLEPLMAQNENVSVSIT